MQDIFLHLRNYGCVASLDIQLRNMRYEDWLCFLLQFYITCTNHEMFHIYCDTVSYNARNLYTCITMQLSRKPLRRQWVSPIRSGQLDFFWPVPAATAVFAGAFPCCCEVMLRAASRSHHSIPHCREARWHSQWHHGVSPAALEHGEIRLRIVLWPFL